MEKNIFKDNLPTYLLTIDEELSSELQVDAVALVDSPAIEKNWIAFKSEEVFVNPKSGEHKDEFLPRCIKYVIDEGKSSEQAVAICNSLWENHFESDFSGTKVSIDYDDTLSTPRGKELAKRLIAEGDTVYIISARSELTGMIQTAKDLGIPESRVYATGSNNDKIQKIKDLGITKHYDNNADVVKELGTIGNKFETFFVTELSEFVETYNDYPKKASENAQVALNWAEKNGWGSCGTPVGKARAHQLASGESISRDTIARMSAFERHRQSSQKELGDGCGRLMWLAWGGDEGIEWASRKLQQIDKKKFGLSLDFSINNDKQELFGPAMLADFPIYRRDSQLGEYNVVFDKNTIYCIVQKFFEKGYDKNFNLMHDPTQKCTGVYAFQSYIVDSAEGRPAPKGYEDAKDGSWFLGVKINNPEVWAKVKSGEIKGFSVEGIFEYKKKEMTAEQIYNEIGKILSELSAA